MVAAWPAPKAVYPSIHLACRASLPAKVSTMGMINARGSRKPLSHRNIIP